MQYLLLDETHNVNVSIQNVQRKKENEQKSYNKPNSLLCCAQSPTSHLPKFKKNIRSYIYIQKNIHQNPKSDAP